jgi:hypothetical protein
MVRSMMLRNPQIRAMDRFFESALDRSLSPFAVMDKVLESVVDTVPPAHGQEFTLYKMTPVKYKVEHKKDGSVHSNVVKEDEDADKTVQT